MYLPFTHTCLKQAFLDILVKHIVQNTILVITYFRSNSLRYESIMLDNKLWKIYHKNM